MSDCWRYRARVNSFLRIALRFNRGTVTPNQQWLLILQLLLQHSSPVIVCVGMKRLIVILSGIIIFSSCGNNHVPDVSGIKVDATIARFDKDFFSADTNHIMQGLDEVQKKYPYFFTDFIQNVVVGGTTDTLHDLATMLKAYIDHS